MNVAVGLLLRTQLAFAIYYQRRIVAGGVELNRAVVDAHFAVGRLLVSPHEVDKAVRVHRLCLVHSLLGCCKVFLGLERGQRGQFQLPNLVGLWIVVFRTESLTDNADAQAWLSRIGQVPRNCQVLGVERCLKPLVLANCEVLLALLTRRSDLALDDAHEVTA